jgi:hypothetical protein
MNPTESLLVLGIAALATAIAVGAMAVPAPLLHSSVSQAFMLVIALILFSYSPVVGISALALFAIIMFHRNVRKTVQYSATLNGMKQYITPMETTDVGGFDAMDRQQRDIQKFQDTYEAYQSEMEQPPTTPQVMEPAQEDSGMYPERSTESQVDVRTDTFMYRPGPDMGDNTFEPVGGSIDNKYASFGY